ncbi:MAG TPA: glycosyltransferase [Candidatus Acidoferrum sp.]|nr:glycosyltransferase [Candidatus Acidoferrum sp.]
MKLTSVLGRLFNAPRFLPLYLALWYARLGSLAPPRLRRSAAWGTGVSVLIPECGTPDLLVQTLAHARTALANVGEPSELVILVNGAPASLYAALQSEYSDAHWHFIDKPLGFNGAIEAGLRHVRHPCVYLLNSDMRLAPDALTTILGYRVPTAFALASQIFFPPSASRREETGLSSFYVKNGRTYMFEVQPPDTVQPGRPIYASGGSSLFRTALLAEYVRGSRDYSPFYWEDADWGARAWAEGLECWFVPTSTAVHEHRGTIKRRFSREEIDRVNDRNGLLFELRHHFTWLDGWRAMVHLTGRPPATRRELGKLSVAGGIASTRRQSMALQRRGFAFEAIERHRTFGEFGEQYFLGRWNPGAPTVLWVTPFSVFPPAHGGARRIVELARRVSRHVNLVLLSDERVGYANCRIEDYTMFQAIHLVQARIDIAGQREQDLAERMQTHTPALLQRALQFLQRYYLVDLVQVEFMEATRLIDTRDVNIPYVAALHDVYLDGGNSDALQREVLQRYDGVVTCSGEDAAHLHGLACDIVPNGATDRLAAATPSPSNATILFMGPFRYQPNFDGIVAFIEHCWAPIRQALPHARLVILAGSEATRPEYAHPLLAASGVTLITEFVDPAPYLAACSLTINPQQEIRGSALKVAEALMARRICVCTRNGARGFADIATDALQRVDDWADMGARIIALLQDDARRHRAEQIPATLARELAWDGQANRLLATYWRLLPSFASAGKVTP